MKMLELEIKAMEEIPAYNGIHCNWVKQAVIVVDKDKERDIVEVIKLLIYEIPGRNGAWTGEFAMSELHQTFREGIYRTAYYAPYKDANLYPARLANWTNYSKTRSVKIIQDNELISLKGKQ